MDNSQKTQIKSDDYYEILGVDKNASTEHITQTFKKLARKWHPDKNTNCEKVATFNMTKILEAKDVLTDPKKRDVYDKYGKKGLDENGHHGMNEEQMQEMMRNMMGGMGGMFNGGMFNGGMGGMFNGEEEDNEIPPVKAVINLTLEELYSGKTIKGTTKRGNLCKNCKGYGSNDGVNHTCDKCNGNGSIIEVQKVGPFMQRAEKKCKDCNGKGIDSSFIKCKDCDGTKILIDEYEFTCKIPRGAYIKYQVTMHNEGNEIPINDRKSINSRSDLNVYVNEMPHDTFKHMFSIGNKKVDPADLLIEKTISLAESLCGFQLSIPFLNGKIIYFSHNKIIKNNDVLVVEGKGMPHIKKNGYGDLYIKINVTYPTEIESATKNRIWQLLTGSSYVLKDKSHEYIECVPIEQFQQNINSDDDNDNHNNRDNDGQQQCPVS